MKWHHLDCFPPKSRPLTPSKEIKGFSSLKGSDQEALRNLKAAPSSKGDRSDKKILKRDEPELVQLERSAKKAKAQDKDEEGHEEIEEKSLETPKSSGAGELEISFSIDDVKNTYKDAALAPNWKSFKTIIFREAEDGLHDSEKVAAFDFDGCLVNTSVKRSGPDAWSLMYPSIPEKLQELYNSGYKLVIFTNEANIERWKSKRQQAVDSKIGRLNGFLKCVKVPMQVFIACGLGKNKYQIDDPFRKPKPGMWKIMTEHFNSGIAIDMDQSFYVGDAAGRVDDHSDADIRFAQAVGLKFHLPEEFFGA